MLGEILASGTALDDVYGIFLGCEPKKSLPKDFGYQAFGLSVMPAISSVHFQKDFFSLFRCYASHEKAGGASFIQLPLDYCIPFATSE